MSVLVAQCRRCARSESAAFSAPAVEPGDRGPCSVSRRIRRRVRSGGRSPPTRWPSRTATTPRSASRSSNGNARVRGCIRQRLVEVGLFAPGCLVTRRDGQGLSGWRGHHGPHVRWTSSDGCRLDTDGVTGVAACLLVASREGLLAMNEGPPGASSDPKEDFRASAASFSQLTGVLGGFCITVLVLALDSDQLGSHRQARDWISGLIIFAALSYIFSSGVLANSLNSAVIRDRMGPEALDEREVFSTQRSFFRFGIALFILGNLPLGATV